MEAGPNDTNLDLGKRPELRTLTSLRWFAAFVVFGYHLSVLTGWLPARVFGFGQSGVAFFFVLSGFVLTWSDRPGQTVGKFYRRRFARIYPSHLVMFLVVGGVVLIWRSAPFEASVQAAVMNVTLTQAWSMLPEQIYAFNGASWTLSNEAFFYLLFPALFVVLTRMSEKARYRFAIAAIVIGLVATILLAVLGFGGRIAFANPIVRLPQFIFGMALAIFIQQSKRRWRSLTIPAFIFFLSVPVAIVVPLFPLQDYILLPAFVMLLAVGATRDLNGQVSWLTSRPLVYLGELSFCFYLVHEVVLVALTDGLWSGVEWTLVTGLIPAVTGLLLSIVAAMVLHHCVERPFQRLLSGQFSVRATHLGPPTKR